MSISTFIRIVRYVIYIYIIIMNRTNGKGTVMKYQLIRLMFDLMVMIVTQTIVTLVSTLIIKLIL